MANIQVNACKTWVDAQGESWEETGTPPELGSHVCEPVWAVMIAAPTSSIMQNNPVHASSNQTLPMNTFFP